MALRVRLSFENAEGAACGGCASHRGMGCATLCGSMTKIRILLAIVVLAQAAPAFSKERVGASGRELYLEECARCHGSAGTGDGADAAFFSPAPRDLTTGFLDRYTEAELVGRVRDGTSLSLAIDPEGRRIRAKRVESIVSHMQRLPDIEWVDVDAGGLLYGARCEVCHGQFGKPWPAPDLPAGVGSVPKDLRDPAVQRSLTDEELVRAFRHGKGSMPAVPPKLTKDEADQIRAFIRVLSPGFEAYSFYCAACHGDSGQGGGIMLRDEAGPKVDFDRAYLDAADPEELRAAVWHMMDVGGGGMPHLRGVVDDARLRSIVEYLQRPR